MEPLERGVMATLYRIDGTTERLTPSDPGKGFTLKEMYSLIGCGCIEPVYLDDGTVFVIDDEGKLKENAMINVKATLHALRHGFSPRDVLVGNALLCDRKEFL